MEPSTPATLSRRQAIKGLSAIGAAGWSRGALAQADRPVRFILPVSAGSGVDTIMRASSQALSKALGQTVVVDNQPGAGGVVGTQALVKSEPDGQTLSLVSNNHVIYPAVLQSVPFDPVADITPIAVVGITPLVLMVNPQRIQARTMKELVDLLKQSPGKYNYASSGNGTILHLAAELFKEVTGTFVTHIPYRGVGPMLQDMLAGQVDMGVPALPPVVQHIKSGALRALCIPSAARSLAAPDVPTSAEAGYANYRVEGWFAVVGPKGLSPEQVRRVHTAFVNAYATAEVKEAMLRQGNIISISTPEQAQAHFKNELIKYAAIVKRAGVKPQ